MKMHPPSVRLIGSCALALWLSACTSSPSGGNPGAAGTGTGAGAAGNGAAGAGQGAAGNGVAGAGQGTAGIGAAGAGQGTAGTGAAGAGQGTAGTGAAGAGQGTAGTGAAGAGTAGSGAAGTGAGGSGAVVKSAGCGMPPRASDSPSAFVKKDVMVTGVDPAFVTKYPMNAGTSYSWTKRNYFVRLPKNYDPGKAYPVDMAGTGCGGGETTGSGGEYTLPPGATGVSPAAGGQPDAIQIGLSYAVSSAANPSCIAFTDDYMNSPEVQYIAAVVDDVSAAYCVSKDQVFVNGYSSGAFESVMAGCADADKLRGFGVQIGGGLRIKHPACVTKPIAAIYVVGTADTGNPIGPLTTAQNDSLGSALSREEVLKRNGCVPANFVFDYTTAGDSLTKFTNAPHGPWNAKYPKCQMYTGCPAKYPVVWCPLDVNHGNGPHPTGGDGAILETYRLQGMWDFFMSLPTP